MQCLFLHSFMNCWQMVSKSCPLTEKKQLPERKLKITDEKFLYKILTCLKKFPEYLKKQNKLKLSS